MVPVLGAEFVDLRSGPLIKLGETFGRDEIGFETRGAGLLSLVLICLLIESFFRRSIILFPSSFLNQERTDRLDLKDSAQWKLLKPLIHYFYSLL